MFFLYFIFYFCLIAIIVLRIINEMHGYDHLFASLLLTKKERKATFVYALHMEIVVILHGR